MVWPLCSNSAMQCLDGFRFFSYKCWGSAWHHRNHRPILRHRSKLIPAWKTIAYMALRMVFIPVQHGCHWKRSWWLKISETFKPSTPLALLRVEGGEQSNGDRQVGTFWGYWHLSQDWRSSGGLFVSLKCGCFFNSKAVFFRRYQGHKRSHEIYEIYMILPRLHRLRTQIHMHFIAQLICRLKDGS